MTKKTQALVEGLRAIASANVCDLPNMGDEAHEPPEITWGELDEIGRTADAAAAALITLARDLETARRIISAALKQRNAFDRECKRLREHARQVDAAVRAARAETWEEASVAEQVARLAHRGQVDKAGRPYIEHVERVVARVKGDPSAEEVAWLHDVIEDTMFSKGTLALFVDDPDTLGAVCTLTRDKEFESYAQYIENVCTSGDPVALKVKLADLRDHLDNPGCPESLRPRYVVALADVERASAAREGQ